MMKFNKLQALGAVILTALLAGCGDEPMPEVNDVNCTISNIKKIENQETKKEFATKCLRRSSTGDGELKSSPKKEW
ncbi:MULTISPECIES: entry exclusion lipoprotein TrbK [Pseudomonadota]|jgi:entry exclusion lipoprotein TrbK|uniref:Entry exclusion lipoprotein TrbK n=3 Tax=Vibrionaceae TaxID=641 RepID=A0A7Y0QZY2_VIBAL|nr:MULTISPECIES: entry exclusion lipoprotein TrbK [Pseudomonadota]HCH1007480.1 entry exclusion lipoprotein TrbK [Vibrio parahaemolyticus]MBU2867314.1 entry exclusion lipoprotein TrbK [Pacificibacter marinus]MBU2955066.1 entry exclusion lipoprotein TrbK [Marinobacter sp. F3R08]MDW1593728.1 entry exclusion lipoprotein TrbK [Vibrio sp. Vb2944]MDW1612289.1 entry exclusion lipoprotein TrbK [Vibrio sp. Vb2908]